MGCFFVYKRRRFGRRIRSRIVKRGLFKTDKSMSDYQLALLEKAKKTAQQKLKKKEPLFEFDFKKLRQMRKYYNKDENE